MPLIRNVVVFCLMVLVVQVGSTTARAAETPVSIELVLAVDTSLSVSDIEFRLQMQGIADALRSEEVADLIGTYNGVAITLIQWAGWTNEDNWLPWHIVKSRESIEVLAQAIENLRRDNVGYLTGIGSAIEAGLKALSANGLVGHRRKIDVSGDGRYNTGIPPVAARARARLAGVTVNGLAITTDVKDLDIHFTEQVITGPGAFVIKATDYEDFARAMKLKLLRELAPATSDTGRGRKVLSSKGNSRLLVGQESPTLSSSAFADDDRVKKRWKN